MTLERAAKNDGTRFFSLVARLIHSNRTNRIRPLTSLTCILIRWRSRLFALCVYFIADIFYYSWWTCNGKAKFVSLRPKKKKQKLICINILGSEKRFHAQHYPLHNKQTNTKPTRIESTKIAHKQYKAHTFATTWHKQPMGQPNTQHKWMWAFSARDVWWRWQQSERENTRCVQIFYERSEANALVQRKRKHINLQWAHLNSFIPPTIASMPSNETHIQITIESCLCVESIFCVRDMPYFACKQIATHLCYIKMDVRYIYVYRYPSEKRSGRCLFVAQYIHI